MEAFPVVTLPAFLLDVPFSEKAYSLGLWPPTTYVLSGVCSPISALRQLGKQLLRRWRCSATSHHSFVVGSDVAQEGMVEYIGEILG